MNKATSVIIGLIVVGVIAIGAILMMNNDDSTKQTADNASQTTQTETSEAAPEQANIVGLATQTEQLSMLVTAVKAASLVETLQGTGPFTVFAPTNAAFNALPAGTLDTLLMPENVEQLKSILTYHVVSGKIMSGDLQNGQIVTTVQGEKLTVKLMDGKAYLVDAKGNEVMVQTADVEASNGVVHIIDGVLLPS